MVPHPILESLKKAKDVVTFSSPDSKTWTAAWHDPAAESRSWQRDESVLLDWRRAVPKTTSGIAQQFSAEQIGLFVKAKKELGLKSKVPDILIAHNGGSDGAAMVSLAGMPEFVGVLQPVKQHIAVLAGLHTTAPAWACNPVLAPVVPTDDYCDLA